MGNERRNIIEHRKHKDDLHRRQPGEAFEQGEKQFTGRCIQTNKRIVHYQYPGGSQQSFSQLKFAQLPTGKENDLLVQQRLDAEEFKQFLFQPFIFDFPQHLPHGGSIFLIVGIPALLIIIVSICCTVCITKSNVFHVIIYCLSRRRRKIVFHRTFTQGIFTQKRIYKQTLPSAVGTYDSDVFAGSDLCCDRLYQTYKRVACYATRYTECVLFHYPISLLGGAKVYQNPHKETE